MSGRFTCQRVWTSDISGYRLHCPSFHQNVNERRFHCLQPTFNINITPCRIRYRSPVITKTKIQFIFPVSRSSIYRWHPTKEWNLNSGQCMMLLLVAHLSDTDGSGIEVGSDEAPPDGITAFLPLNTGRRGTRRVQHTDYKLHSPLWIVLLFIYCSMFRSKCQYPS